MDRGKSQNIRNGYFRSLLGKFNFFQNHDPTKQPSVKIQCTGIGDTAVPKKKERSKVGKKDGRIKVGV